ncbi:MAG TPA: beta-propeller domain-containing protein [Pyrinomonadaceae bacterium]|nr:beta-propeller domain-containing protein [Pyrinomonadaceae bacterium]
MKRTLLLLLLTLGLFSCTTAFAVSRTPKKMKAFTSERELRRYFRKIAEKQKRAAESKVQMLVDSMSEVVTVSSTAEHQESITNTQHAGVDEGGIVKLHGDHLVMLRRGRLFTVAIGALRPVSTIDAFGPDIDPKRSWYDEMLIYGDTVVVIGYSYQRDATEVGLFNIDSQGQLSYRSTYHLRSNDYYSSRNYASRLIGSKLIFYTPLHFYAGGDNDPFEWFPAVSKWHKDATSSDFRRIVSASRVYRPEAEFEVEDGVTLHTVTICDLANGGFDCKATSVVGPSGNIFYVSPDSVYVWTTSWSKDHKQSPSLVFRLPLDGSGPGALRVSGAPVDQFSFLQSEDRYLNVLVRAEAKGDGMWAAEVAEGDVAFMRIPLSSFSDGSQMAPATSYQQLPEPEGYFFQNRFVGGYLLYGTGSGWGDPKKTTTPKNLFMLEYARGTLHRFDLPHGIDRIEQMGTGAVVVGTDGTDLHFTSIRLNPQPQIVSRYTREAASQGELRSHGFFYKPDGEDSGTLGLPISKPARPGYLHLFENSAALLFLRNDAFQFSVLGELDAQSEKAQDDKCRASCVDWYGNARPLFLRGRMFALLGYELVEGKLEQGRMIELRRISYAPQVSEREP